MPRKTEKRGVYFLASDPVLELATAFLESFRRSNPDPELCLVPFSSEISRISALKDRYRFTVFRNEAVLDACDEISRRFHGKASGEYRKLAMWEGAFDEFLYFDVDSVVLERADFAWEWLKSYDFIASQSNIPETARHVWKESIWETGALTPQQISYSASTGFIASKRGVLGLRHIEERLDDALKLSPHMALRCKEQPLLNFLVVTSRLRATSLAKIAAQNPDLDIPLEKWAGARLKKHVDGRLLNQSPRVFFVHWAGMWTRGMHKDSELWNYYYDEARAQ